MKIAATLPPSFRNHCVTGTCGWWQQGGRWQQGPTPNPSPKGRGAAARRGDSKAPPPTPPRKGGERLRAGWQQKTNV